METGTVSTKTSQARMDPIFKERQPETCTVVIFGANGDLTRRKLVPALYNLTRDGLLDREIRVIGFSRSAKTTDAYRRELQETTGRHSRTQPLEDEVWNVFAGRVEYISGTFDDVDAFQLLAQRIAEIEARGSGSRNRLFYLATPPAAFARVLEQLKRAGLLHPEEGDAEAPWSRVIIEKPFGRDLASARQLNREVLESLDERQVYRIDHYLGKETVQNILVFRFGNSIFEPLWNRKYIDHVQITGAESVAVGTRGGFYDRTGVVRDVVQNHLLQVLALVAMEQPISFAADEIRNEKLKVLRSLQPVFGADPEDGVIWGQYDDYRQEPNVAVDSRTPTYFALKAEINNWRWQGVPFYIRAGKALAKRHTEVAIHFQSLPICLFGQKEACQRLENNVLVIRIQPNEGIDLRFNSKSPGEDLSIGNVQMSFTYAGAFQRAPSEAYERLILDSMRGDQTLFDRNDSVESAWEYITPIVEAYEGSPETPLHPYPRNSAGPEQADRLLGREGRLWRKL